MNILSSKLIVIKIGSSTLVDQTDNFNNMDKNKIIQLLRFDRRKTSKLGRELFNVKTIGNSYLTLYKRVLHN